MTRDKIANGIVAASLVLFGLPLSAHAITESLTAGAAQTAPSVIIFNQKMKGGEIVVTYAYLPTAGHLVIHRSERGKPGKDVIGSVSLEAGDHRDVAVKLDKSLPSGTSLRASLTNSEKQPLWKRALPLQNEFTIE